jgi:hypothetical protein
LPVLNGVTDGFELAYFGIGGLDFVELSFDAVFGRIKTLVNIIFITDLFDRPLPGTSDQLNPSSPNFFSSKAEMTASTR